jgi:predicted alpha/beta superfamily hydrolase
MSETFPPVSLFGTESRAISSKIVGRDYQLSIWLPLNYKKNNLAYPVVYLLDADLLFSLLVSPAFDLVYFGKEAPEFILVGIGYNANSYDEWGKSRADDFYPPDAPGGNTKNHAPEFLSFLKQELIPFIERNYRIDPAERILFGYSLSGFFAHYAWQHEPGLFRRYFSSSGLYEASCAYLIAHLNQINPKDYEVPTDFVITVGSLESHFLPYFHTYTNALKGKELVGLNLQTLVLEGQRHGTAGVLMTFMQGMKLLFKDRIQ